MRIAFLTFGDYSKKRSAEIESKLLSPPTFLRIGHLGIKDILRGKHRNYDLILVLSDFFSPRIHWLRWLGTLIVDLRDLTEETEPKKIRFYLEQQILKNYHKRYGKRELKHYL